MFMRACRQCGEYILSPGVPFCIRCVRRSSMTKPRRCRPRFLWAYLAWYFLHDLFS